MMSYESVVKQLQADLLDHSVTIGMTGMRFTASRYPEGLWVGLKVLFTVIVVIVVVIVVVVIVVIVVII